MANVKENEWKYTNIPTLEDGEVKATTDKEKANMLGKSFTSTHSGNHLDDLHKKRKEEVLNVNRDRIKKKGDDNSTLDAEITMSELKIALHSTRNTATGQDQLSYVMFCKLPDKALSVILKLFNKIWREGLVPKSWKSALILPFRKPGKDQKVPGNYRPIALTSHLCKWMEKIY